MHLRRWQRKNKRMWPTERLARTLGVSRMTLWRWTHGGSIPDDAMIASITILTRGAVQLRDWYPEAAISAAMLGKQEL